MVTTGGAEPASADNGIDDDQFYENLRATAELQIREDGEDGVRLNGGPMDGWLVLKDAPSMAPDWHKTWPSGMTEDHEPGRYQVSESGTWAEWVPVAAQ